MDKETASKKVTQEEIDLLQKKIEELLNYPKDEEEYRLVKCIKNKEYDEVRKVYPFFGVTPWYTPMIDDKFIEYFNNPENSFEGIYDNHLFHEFYEIVHGIMEGDNCKLLESEYAVLSTFKTFLVSRHFQITCPEDKGEFKNLYMNILSRSVYGKQPEDMTVEELAGKIVYWFRVRMGSSCEIEMAQNGKIGKYLKLIKEKSLQTDK